MLGVNVQSAIKASAALLIGLTMALATVPARAGPALLFEPTTGAVLHAYEPFQRWHPASLAKLMTLYLVFDAIESGQSRSDSPVRVSQRAAAETVNTMGWPVGTEITLADAIPILAVKSANDIAVAVAEAVGGSVEEFVTRMNETADTLGMSDSHFVNPHGLHDARQFTTARDLALLIQALGRDFPDQREVFAVARTEVRGQELTSFNRLLGAFPGADGLKTGYVCSSGWNIAASATREGRQLVAIVLGGLREGQREEIAGELLEAGFAADSGGAQSLGSLARPAAADGPVDMRPYACEGRTPPPHIASFGLELAPLPRPRPANE